MEEIIRDLELRLARAETALAQIVSQVNTQGTILHAPVKVIDKDGRTLLEIVSGVNDTSIHIFNKAGFLAAALGYEGSGGGYLAIRNAVGQLVGYLDVESYGGRLQISGNEEGGVVIFGGDSDNEGGGININSASRESGGDISLWASIEGGQIAFYNPQSPDMIISADYPNGKIKDDQGSQ